MKTIAIVNQKGGVGKTTTAEALAAGLTERGFKTLAIDLDPQGNLTYTAGEERNGLNAFDVLTRRADVKDAIREREDRYDVLPASALLAGADLSITETGKEYRLKEVLKPLEGVYDYIVVDTPPALGILTVNALTAADVAIIPAAADVLSVQGMGALATTIGQVKEYTNPGLKIAGILLTCYNGRTVLSRNFAGRLEAIAGELDTKLFDAKIREAVAIREAQLKRADFQRYAPRATATQDYESFIDELLAEA